jgi:hypothetical protein
MFNNRPAEGAKDMAYAYAGNFVFGVTVGLGVRAVGVVGGSALASASQAAFKAAENINSFRVPLKHLAGAAGRWGKFAHGVDAKDAIREALISPNATFRPNRDSAESFLVITDLGRQVGTKGETAVRVVVGNDGKIWTAFPVKSR